MDRTLKQSVFGFIFSIGMVILPHTASAINYTFLSPLPNVDTSGNLLPYLISLLSFAIGVAGVIGVVRLVICGFELLTAPGESKRSHAKECLWKVVLGLLLAVSAFVLLRSINPALTTPTLDLPATPSTLLSTSSSQTQQGGQKMCGAFAITLGNCNNNVPSITYAAQSEASARFSLPSGIAVNNPMCTDSCSCNCTNIQGLPQSVFMELNQLRQDAGGARVTISGGTEAHLHRSHLSGQPIFDIAKLPAIDSVIRSGVSRPSFGGYTEYRHGNFWYTDEGSHWHVCEVGTNSTYCAP